MKKIGVLSDTHGTLDEPLLRFLEPCEEIWHAGDIGSEGVADRLEKMAILRAVYGNIDDHRLRTRYPEFQYFECEGHRVLITHIGGTPSRYQPGLLAYVRKHPAGILVTGHSHILRVQYDERQAWMFINPGAAGRSGFHQKRTILRFDLDREGLHRMEVLELSRG